MRTIIVGCMFLGLLSGLGPARSADPPLNETRLTVHTLVREDIFAGWRKNDQQRLARGEKNIEQLLELRPDARADLLAWQGSIALFRAAVAHEAGKEQKFQQLYQDALDLFAASEQADPKSPGGRAVAGGGYVLFADRLPESVRGDAWQACYDNYQVLYTIQAPILERLPTHIRGELLAGLAQSSLRTGRTAEYEGFLEQIIKLLPETAYAQTALKWRESPEAAATGTMACKTCHGPGRLTARLANLNKQ
jgi:predicted nucleic acid-binding protein